MRLNRYSRAIFAIAAFACVAGMSRVAEAQIHPSFYGSAEADTRDAQFYLLGMYAGMGRAGWSPYFNVNAYRLHYPFAGGSRNLTAVSPTLGLAYAGRRQGVSVGGGYAFVSNEDPGAPGAEGGGSDGATVSLGAYHNARGKRAMNTQLLANYNFGSRYVWARGRASVPFGISTKHPARLGAELIGQGGGKNGRESSSFALGPTLEYSWAPNFRTTGAIGYKSVSEGNSSRESAAYFKLEFSFSP